MQKAKIKNQKSKIKNRKTEKPKNENRKINETYRMLFITTDI